MNNEQGLSYFGQLGRKADLLLIKVMWVLGAISFAMSFWYHTLGAFVWIGVPTLVATSLQVYLNSGKRIARLTIATGFMLFAAVIIHQAHGMIEMHFFVFVLLAMLLYYRDWTPIVTAAAVIAVHHVVFDQLQRRGFNVWVFAQNTGLIIVVIHAAFVVAESFVLILMATQLRREVLQVGIEPTRLARLSASIERGEDVDTGTAEAVPAHSIAAAMFRMNRVIGELLGEMQSVVGAQAAGDFSRRLKLEGRDGRFGELASAINSACAQTETAMHEAVAVLGSVARGDLSQRIASDMGGDFEKLKLQTNGTVEFLERFCRDQQSLVAAAVDGRLDRRFELGGLEGYQLELAAGLNRQLDAFEDAVGGMSALLNGLAQGRLDSRLQMHSTGGRFGQLIGDGDTSMRALRDLMMSVSSVVEQVGISSREIAHGNRDLSNRTESQSMSLQRTAASATQLAATVKQNAGHAREADRLARTTSDVAREGAQAVEAVVRTMSDIDKSSSRIADIIGVIDGIAFQTNILALNAAIEAARAGEQGRGFAVVASEVRSLAQRSASAAKEIKQLIEDSAGRVGEGSCHVDNAGQRMRQVVEQISSLAEVIAQISAASSEQSIGIEQISQDIAGLEEIAQQNAAMVEEVSSASMSLDDSARALGETVARFSFGRPREAVNDAKALRKAV